MKLVLKNVRLSFPSLFEHEEYQGQDTGKFAATFLVPKDHEMAQTIQDAVTDAAKEKWGTIKGIKFPLRDGDSDEIDYSGYEGCWALKGNTKRRPVLVDRGKNPVSEGDGVFYPGCRVNASVEVFAHKSEAYGKRVGCQLNGIQFAGDDESFGATNDSLNDFEADESSEEAPKKKAGETKPEETEANPFA